MNSLKLKGLIITILLVFCSTMILFAFSPEFHGNKKVDEQIFDSFTAEVRKLSPEKSIEAQRLPLVRVVVHLVDEDEPKLLEVGTNMIDLVAERVATRQQRFLQNISEKEFKVATTLSLQYAVAGYISYEGLRRLAALPEVKSIDLDNLNIPFTNEGRQLMNIDWVASNLGYDGTGITVGVIDSAFDYRHADFGGYNSFPNPVIVDGYDFSGNNSNIYPSNYNDGYHGTGVAGIVIRTAPGAQLVLAQVFPNAYDSVIANAINFMAQKQSDYNIRVINMSLGGGAFTSICSNATVGGAINNAVAAGIIPVAASGNDGHTNRMAMPACLPNVISVGSVFDVNNANYQPFWPANCSQNIRRQDERICYSNAASFLDIYAPSEEVITSQVFGGQSALGGTSSASPYAAAAIAILLQSEPSLYGNVDAVRQRLHDTGAPVIGDLGYGQRRIDLKEAIDGDGGGTDPGTDCTEQEFVSSDVPKNIPDNNANGVNSSLHISQSGTISSLKISVNISHTWRGDLKLKLRSPSGTEILFYDPPSNDSNNNIIGSMNLTQFNGENMNGTWTFNVSDHASQDTGSIQSWSLTICHEGTQTDPDPDPEPVINNFYANPGTITQGSSTRLYWSTSNTTSVEIVGIGTYSSSSGNIQVSPTASRSYTLRANGPGGQVQATTSVTVEQQTDDCTPQSFSFSSGDVPKAIPDNSPAGINSYLTVPGGIEDISNFSVSVNISHTYRGDLIVKLFSPAGKEFVIHNRSGGSANNVIGTFDTNIFNGDNASGQWRLFVSDNARWDTGTLNSWSIDFHACGDSDDTDPTDPPPDSNETFISSDTPLNIPDNNPTGITSTINVTRNSPANIVQVSVDITHTYIGDLIITLMTPAGNVVLHNREGGSTSNLSQTWNINYNGNNPHGQWRLKVEDRARFDTGTLDNWKIEF